MKPKTLILRAAGTNCDRETAFAFERAGATAEFVHVNRLLRERKLLNNYQILAIPGGFSYGDDIAAGRILANQLRHHLGDVLRAFIDAGRPVIGVCNGFQVLVKTDLLPGQLAGRSGQTCTLAHNVCGRFVDRWVRLSVPQDSKCIWTRGLPDAIELPVAHGEGRFVCADDSIRQELWTNGQVALQYADATGALARGVFPDNPNGSTDDIAGICDATGLVFGLMPHPERFVDRIQHYAWSGLDASKTEGSGLAIFRNAVEFVCEGVTQSA